MRQQTWWAVKPQGGHGTPARPFGACAAMSARFAAYGHVDLAINATVRPRGSRRGATG